MTGIRPNTISELYNEVATRISLDHLDLICEALGCDLTDLIGGTQKIKTLKPLIHKDYRGSLKYNRHS